MTKNICVRAKILVIMSYIIAVNSTKHGTTCNSINVYCLVPSMAVTDDSNRW